MKITDDLQQNIKHMELNGNRDIGYELENKNEKCKQP